MINENRKHQLSVAKKLSAIRTNAYVRGYLLYYKWSIEAVNYLYPITK